MGNGKGKEKYTSELVKEKDDGDVTSWAAALEEEVNDEFVKHRCQKD